MARSVKEQLGVELPEPIQAPPPEVTPGSQEGEQRPEWLPDNFKRPEDLVTSYQEAQNRIREQGDQQKALEGQLAQLTQVVEGMQTPQQQQQAPTGDINEQLLAAYENDPIGTVVFLANQVADQRYQTRLAEQQPYLLASQQAQGELIANTANQVMESKFKDWDSYGVKVGELIERNPGLMPAETLQSLEATTRALEAIYKQVKYDDLAKQIEDGTFNSEQSRMKAQAQTISGTVGKPGQLSDQDEKINRLIAAAKNSSYSAMRGNA